MLAAYNGIDWLREQVDSILSQHAVDLTLFVSVDASTDGTEAWFDELAKLDTRIVVLSKGHRFGGAAPNFFRLIRDVDFEQFDFVGFADQDDIWQLDKLSRALEQIRLHDVDGYSSNVMAFWPTGKERLVCKSQPQRKLDYYFESAGPGSTYVLKKSLMLEIKNCACRNWEQVQAVNLHDWFCYFYSRAHGYRWYIDVRPSMAYRQHGDNQIGVNSGVKAFVYRFKSIVSGSGIEQSALIAQLIGGGDTDFVDMWFDRKRISFLRLAFFANACRRRRRDRVFFFCACLTMVVLGRR